MLVIRGFEQRVAALYRDGEVPGLRAPVDRAGGVGGRRVLAARPDRRDHVDPPRPRALPGQGPRRARDVRRADGARTTAPTAGGAARCTSPTRRSASSAPTASSAPGLPIAVGAATAAQLRDDGTRRGRVLRRRRGRARRVPRSGEPRRGVAAAGDLLLREQRLRRVLARADAARGDRSSSAPRATASSTSRSTATTSSPPPPRCTTVVDGVRAGGGPVLVEATTYRWHGHYEGDPRALPHAGGGAGVGGARSARRSARAACAPPASPTTTLDALRAVGRAASSTPRSTPPGACRARRSTTLATSSSGPGPSAPSRPRRPADAPVFRTMDAVRDALEVELAADERVFVAGIDVAAGGNVFGLTRGLHDEFGDRGARHADLRDRDRRASVSARRWRACGRSSSSCTSTSSACASTSC